MRLPRSPPSSARTAPTNWSDRAEEAASQLAPSLLLIQHPSGPRTSRVARHGQGHARSCRLSGMSRSCRSSSTCSGRATPGGLVVRQWGCWAHRWPPARRGRSQRPGGSLGAHPVSPMSSSTASTVPTAICRSTGDLDRRGSHRARGLLRPAGQPRRRTHLRARCTLLARRPAVPRRLGMTLDRAEEKGGRGERERLRGRRAGSCCRSVPLM